METCKICKHTISVSRNKGAEGVDENGNPIPFWTDDPLYTVRGLAGEVYKGQTPLRPIHIIELQNYYKELEEEYLIEADRTQFLLVDKKSPSRHVYIEQLRISVEKILDITGSSLVDYFKYDYLGNDTGLEQTDWTDIDRSEGYPKLPKGKPVRAIHVEELRRGIALVLVKGERWDIWGDEVRVLEGTKENKLGRYEEMPYYSYNWPTNDWKNYYTEDYLFWPLWKGDIGEIAWKGDCEYPEVDTTWTKLNYIIRYYDPPSETCTFVDSWTNPPTYPVGCTSKSTGKIVGGKLHLEAISETTGGRNAYVFSPNDYCNGPAYIGECLGALTKRVDISAEGTFSKYPTINENKLFTIDFKVLDNTIARSSISWGEFYSHNKGNIRIIIRVYFQEIPEEILAYCDNPECDFKAYNDAVRGIIPYNYNEEGYPCPICYEWTRPGENEPRRSMIIPGESEFISPVSEVSARYTLDFCSDYNSVVDGTPTTEYKYGKRYHYLYDKRPFENVSGIIDIDLFNRFIKPAQAINPTLQYLKGVKISAVADLAFAPFVSGYLGADEPLSGGNGSKLIFEVDNIGLKAKPEE